MDGFEVAQKLRTQRRTKDVPIIYLTEKRARADRMHGSEIGADDYVTKPFDIQELRLRVRNALRRSTQGPLINSITGLPEWALLDEKLTACLKKDSWGLMLVSIENLDSFREAYGFVAADDVLRAMSVIIVNTLKEVGDLIGFVGQLTSSEFILISDLQFHLALKDRLESRGTGWHLVVKTDAGDMTDPVARGGWVLWGVVILLLAAAGGTMALWWDQQRARERTRNLSEELERETWKAQALQREARLAALFDHAADAVFVHDRNGRILEANEQAVRELGYGRAELCAMNVSDIAPEGRPGGPDGLWNSMRPGDTATVNGVHQRKDGSTFPVEVRLALIRGAQDDYFIATARAVTAQHAGLLSLA